MDIYFFCGFFFGISLFLTVKEFVKWLNYDIEEETK